LRLLLRKLHGGQFASKGAEEDAMVSICTHFNTRGLIPDHSVNLTDGSINADRDREIQVEFHEARPHTATP